MLKTIVITLIAVVSGTWGDILMAQAMKSIGEVKVTGLRSLWRTGITVFTTPKVWLAIFFMAVFFFLWLAVLSWAELTFALPLTALTYVLNALLAPSCLGEQVTPLRWLGTVVIALGVALVAYSEALAKSAS